MLRILTKHQKSFENLLKIVFYNLKKKKRDTL